MNYFLCILVDCHTIVGTIVVVGRIVVSIPPVPPAFAILLEKVNNTLGLISILFFMIVFFYNIMRLSNKQKVNYANGYSFM